MNRSKLISGPNLAESISFEAVRQAISDIGSCDRGRRLYLETLIAAAYDYVQQHTKRALLQQEREMVVVNPGDTISLHYPPIMEVTSVERSVTATECGDVCWVPLTWSQYSFNCSKLLLKDVSCGCSAYSKCSCTTQLRVRYVCGPTTLEPMAAMAICMLVGHWDFNKIASSNLNIREVPLALDSLIRTLRKRHVHGINSVDPSESVSSWRYVST